LFNGGLSILVVSDKNIPAKVYMDVGAVRFWQPRGGREYPSGLELVSKLEEQESGKRDVGSLSNTWEELKGGRREEGGKKEGRRRENERRDIGSSNDT
jgi:hypothetical protein